MNDILIEITKQLTDAIGDTLSTGFYLLPGLITYYTYRYCRKIPDHTPFEVVVFSLFYTIIDLLAFGILTRILPVDPENIYVLYLLATILGILFVLVDHYDLILRVLRSVRITDKTNRLTVWKDTMKYARNTYVRVFTKDHLMYVGFIRYYSETLDPTEVFLTDVTVYLEGRDYTFEELEKIGGIYITKENIRCIQYLDIPEKDKPTVDY